MSMGTVMTTEAGVEPVQAADLFGTPLFYYSLGTLRAQIARLRRAMSHHPVQLLFATMANERADILRAIADEDVGACVNSIPHLQRALANGFRAERVQFTSCGLPLDDMSYLQALDICANLDSPSQIAAWCGLKPNARVGARINAASLAGSLLAFEDAGAYCESMISRFLGQREPVCYIAKE